ncbi:MAG: hypothetical protein AAGB46_03390 [Verrucomicrobiota bacterium]
MPIKHAAPILLLVLLTLAYGCAIVTPAKTVAKKGTKTTVKTVKKVGGAVIP